MLVVEALPRVFTFKDNNNIEVVLTDPSPDWPAETVRRFYGNTYPYLTTAVVHGPVMERDQLHFEFKSIFGTKG